jgi:hypothetical protein
MFCKKPKVSEASPWKQRRACGTETLIASGGQKLEVAHRPSAEGPRACATHDSFSLAHKK